MLSPEVNYEELMTNTVMAVQALYSQSQLERKHEASVWLENLQQSVSFDFEYQSYKHTVCATKYHFTIFRCMLGKLRISCFIKNWIWILAILEHIRSGQKYRWDFQVVKVCRLATQDLFMICIFVPQNSFHELPEEAHFSLRDSLLSHVGAITMETDQIIVTQVCCYFPQPNPPCSFPVD